MTEEQMSCGTWTVVGSLIPNRPVSTAEILRMVADGWHLTPGTAAYQTCVDQLRARADELDAATVEAAEPDPSVPVPIPLPPEPPRDRLIEAVDAEGQVCKRFTKDGKYWVCELGAYWFWRELLSKSISQSWTLRHRAAEEET